MKQQDLLIGFDLGTSAIKAILTDTTGRLVSRASRQVTFMRPEPGRCEIDPDAWYATSSISSASWQAFPRIPAPFGA